MTIRSKLLLSSCTPLTVVVIALTVYSVTVNESAKHESLSQKASLFGDLVVSSVGPSLAMGDVDDTKHALAAVPHVRDLSSVVILDGTGKVVATAGDGVDERASKQAFLGSAGRRQIVETSELMTLVSPIGEGKDRVGTAVFDFKKAAMIGDIRRMTLISVLAAALGALVCVAMAIRMARAIAVPLEEMSKMAVAIALGDVEHDIAHRSDDEIGVFATAFRGVIGYVRDVARGIERLGAGDLTAELKPHSDKDLVAKNFLAAVGSLRATMQHMSEAAVALSGASDDLGNVSQQMGANADATSSQAQVVAAVAEQMSRNMQSVASSTEQMTNSVQGVARSAADAARVATTAVQVAATTNHMVNKLSDSSAEIGNVIKVITSIAEQTNLLALNATIEAARAGDAGKGFAVVAHEVKELAKATARATEDIGRKIAAIQNDARGVVDSITEISTTIAQVNQIQSAIAQAVTEQAATTGEIGRNVSEAARSTTEIARNIISVAEAARGTASGAAKTESSASTLSRMASDLRAEVGRFETGDGRPAPDAHAPGLRLNAA
jgi:methyl-accepting chemotaxis protein